MLNNYLTPNAALVQDNTTNHAAASSDPSVCRSTQSAGQEGLLGDGIITPAITQPQPPAPRTPYIWSWVCHQCGSAYPLACIRRCLHCSHQYCTVPAAENGDSKNLLRGKRRICTTEFDYNGWAAWGAYRRSRTCAPGAGDYDDTFATWELTTKSRRRYGRSIQSPPVWQRLAKEKREQVSRRKEMMYVQGRHNCSVHCDFPSECLHTVHTALVEGRAFPARERESSSSQLQDEQQEYLEEERSPGLNWKATDELYQQPVDEISAASESSNDSDADYSEGSDSDLDEHEECRVDTDGSWFRR
ncbi:hypothetical protein C8A00DRAFT_16382 [Chaetomidium leptoderma]|uniref:Uncharacterized protein n=1 Tax=Chaetomidium leptoderma TaxID=669021 RepID=A0AAN6VL91_9PEZI|nr:hypothetical protein C8A00DRAFT_16382 [Chaetomidium leptoderma]